MLIHVFYASFHTVYIHDYALKLTYYLYSSLSGLQIYNYKHIT